MLTFDLMQNDAIHTLNDKYLRLFGIPITVAAVLLIQMSYFFPGRWDLFARYAVVSVLFTALMWEIARWVVVRLRRRFPALEQTRHRIAWLLLIFTIQLGIGQGLLTKLVFVLRWTETKEPYLKVWLINFAFSLFFIVVIAGIYEAIYFFNQYKYALQKAEQLKKQQAQLRLDALKTRVNPHFLFNSLTTLSALIGEDAPKAERFLDELSKVYRYLLRAVRHPMVALEEEFEFAKSYAFLLESRFGEGEFGLNFEKSDRIFEAESDQYLPVLTFQNAIDYLVRTQNLPLKIEVKIFAKHLQFACVGLSKNLAFDASQHDWQHLENSKATRHSGDEGLVLDIPFARNPATT